MRVADIFSTFIVVITYNFGKYTRVNSFFSSNIARISSTVVVITTDNIIIYTSYIRVTISTLTGIFVRAFNSSISTTTRRVTRVNGTVVSIIAVNI
jgi:hypothetical protein